MNSTLESPAKKTNRKISGNRPVPSTLSNASFGGLTDRGRRSTNPVRPSWIKLSTGRELPATEAEPFWVSVLLAGLLACFLALLLWAA